MKLNELGTSLYGLEGAVTAADVEEIRGTVEGILNREGADAERYTRDF